MVRSVGAGVPAEEPTSSALSAQTVTGGGVERDSKLLKGPLNPKPKLGAPRGSLAKLGDMKKLQDALWEIIAKLQEELAAQGTLIDALPLKAAHTLATLAGVFVRLHETASLEERLTLLERKILDNSTRPS
jgi:hypothetical protein